MKKEQRKSFLQYLQIKKKVAMTVQWKTDKSKYNFKCKASMLTVLSHYHARPELCFANPL